VATGLRTGSFVMAPAVTLGDLNEPPANAGAVATVLLRRRLQ